MMISPSASVATLPSVQFKKFSCVHGCRHPTPFQRQSENIPKTPDATAQPTPPRRRPKSLRPQTPVPAPRGTHSPPDSPPAAKSRLTHHSPHCGPSGGRVGQPGWRAAETEKLRNVRAEFEFGWGSVGWEFVDLLGSLKIIPRICNCFGSVKES